MHSENQVRHWHESARPSLRTAHHPGSILIAMVTVAVAAGLIWSLATAELIEARTATTLSPSADRAAGSAVHLSPRVSQVDAAALSNRAIELAEAVRTAEAVNTRAAVIRVARRQLGDPYRAGHTGPNAFDCSGFTKFVFQQAANIDLPRTSWSQYRSVEKISSKQAQPGDLVFFFERGAHHVGIYLGNGQMIDAPRTGKKVSVNPISGSWWGRTFTGFGRVLPA